MRGSFRAFGRLLILQASWTYERMQGVGVGFASLPLLEPLRPDPERYRAAVTRAAEYFNANPYLAGIAVGAAARAELDRAPGDTIRRLRTALCGPLGSLGDQLFWVGVVPALIGVALLGVAFHGSPWLVAGLVAIFNLIRIGVTYWGLRMGAKAGLRVAAALGHSQLARTAERVGWAAGLAVGAGAPGVALWLLDGRGSIAIVLAALGAVGGAVAARVPFRVPSALHLTLGVLAIVILWHWSTQ